MKLEVRDDLMPVEVFTAARFHYDKILRLIYDAGYYCLLKQFKSVCPSNKALKELVELKLIVVKKLNSKNKFIALSNNAMKYILLSDSDEDYSVKNPSVRKVPNNPSHKALMVSIYKFDLFTKQEQNELIRRLISRDSFENNIELLAISKELNYETFSKRIVFYSNNIYQEEMMVNCSMIENKLMNYYDKSKIYFYNNINNFYGFIFDTGSFKSAEQYFEHFDEVRNYYKLFNNSIEITVFIISYSKSRTKFLKQELDRISETRRLLNDEFLKHLPKDQVEFHRPSVRLVAKTTHFDSSFYLDDVLSQKVYSNNTVNMDERDKINDFTNSIQGY